MNILTPSVWLIVLIAGLPQLSETIYTPSLPNIAHNLDTTAPMVEYTLTIYLVGFALGTLVWGKFSDSFGRKAGILLGLIVFLLGCLGCYLSPTITVLMISRFVQAFGGSIGSVLGQAICRDAFQGRDLGRVYAIVGSALAAFPALGPVIGGIIADTLGWRSIFIVLMLFAIILLFLIAKRLPETHAPEQRTAQPMLQIMVKLAADKQVLGFGLLVAGCNGISFSYFAEGPFYFIKMLGLSSSQYGASFIVLAFSTLSGGLFSKYLHQKYTANYIVQYGLIIIMSSTGLWGLLLLCQSFFMVLTNSFIIITTLLFMMGTMFGICMVTSNALAQALINYKWCTGTASSLFGFFYYSIISCFTWGIGYMHNGTLLVMPWYFITISLFMYFIQKVTLPCTNK